MKKFKSLLKDIIFILVCIIIFKSLISYQLAKSDFQTYEYTVNYGETLWNIAGKISSENSELYIKNIINDIKELNNLEDPTIYVGQVIKLPIYK